MIIGTYMGPKGCSMILAFVVLILYTSTCIPFAVVWWYLDPEIQNQAPCSAIDFEVY